MQFGKAGDLVSILIHIAFWAQIGVLTRIYLNKFFNDGCQGYWGVCLTSDGSCLSMSSTLLCNPFPAVSESSESRPQSAKES